MHSEPPQANSSILQSGYQMDISKIRIQHKEKSMPTHYPECPDPVQKDVQSIANELEAAFAGEVLSINLLPASVENPTVTLQVILFEVSIGMLNSLRPLCQEITQKHQLKIDFLAYPDCLDWLQRSPLSLLQLQQHSVCLVGENLLMNLSVVPENLRQELEKKLADERFHFRQTFLHASDTELGQLLLSSRRRFSALEAGLMFLRGSEPSLSNQWLATLYGLQQNPLPELPADLQPETLTLAQQHYYACEWDTFLNALQQKLGQMFEVGGRDTQEMVSF